jgi:DegV family protein with EDD domain
LSSKKSSAIRYLNGARLRRSLIAAADWVEAGCDELNRINVFPVPDGDTGTNFTMTIRSVADSVGTLENSSLPVVNRAMAQSCVLGAHGNSGMLLSQFLIGFREEIGDRTSADVHVVAQAVGNGFERLSAALDNPVEGTILTVCREVAEAAEKAAKTTDDLKELLSQMVAEANASLERTPELLPALKEAGVVDAGAMGFVRLLEGILRLVEGLPVTIPGRVSASSPSAASMASVDMDKDFQFCTEVLVRGDGIPASTAVREHLRAFGGSIVVLKTEDLLKIHVHTDSPDDVFKMASEWGTIEATKADDMREQHSALHVEQSSLEIVVDSSCDLTEELIAEAGIIMVPMQIIHEGNRYRDRIDTDLGEIYERMRREKAVYTTSQPTPGAFREAYRDALTQGSEVLCLSVSGALSGTLNSASTVAELDEFSTVSNFDSRNVSMGLGMLALRARELSEAGCSTDEIIKDLTRIRDQSGLFVTFDTFEHIVRSGRVSRAKGWLGNLLDVKPIMALDPVGAVVPVDRVRGIENVVPRMMELLEEKLTPRPARLRMAVMHADALDTAERVKTEIQKRFNPYEVHIGSVTAVIGVHTGPGAWAVIYQNEDK